MANMMDYLEWRGDLTLSQAPFNEVDNLILSQLAYVDFAGIVCDATDMRQAVTIRQAAEQFYRMRDTEKILAQVSMTKSAILVLKKMAGTPRFGDMRLFGYRNEISETEQSQFAVISIVLPDDSIYVAYSGTDATLIGWREDFNMIYLSETSGHRKAVSYIEDLQAVYPGPYLLGGHSKGGNFAAYAAMFCRQDAKGCGITTVYSNDGPGFDQAIVDSERYRAIVPKLYSIIPESSLVGMLLSHKERYVVVQSDNTGLSQHDPMSWQVLGNHFVEAVGMDSRTVMLDETLEEWLAHYTKKEREMMVEAVFSVLDAAGIKTVDDFFDMHWYRLREAIRAKRELSEDTTNLLSQAFRLLLRSGRDNMRRFLQSRYDG